MKSILFLLTALLTLNISIAQQDKQLTHYIFDKMSYNPAATGFNGYCATVIYRNQWDQVEMAPNTTLFNLQANIPRRNLGIGLSVTNDAIGFQRNNTVTLNSAYHLKTNAGVLSGGVGLGFINVGFAPIWIPPQTPIDPNLPLPLTGTGFDMNAGLYWHSATRPYYVGLSTTHVVPASLKTINFSVARHYYLLGGYNFTLDLSNRIDIKPNILVKADGATAIFDLNIISDFWINPYTYLWGGLSYRLEDAVAVSIGYATSFAQNPRLNLFKIGYSFDIMTNALNPHGRGTHELMLNFCIFPPKQETGRYRNPFFMEF